MKAIYYLLVGMAFILQCCKGQTTPKKEIYNSDFKWTITIPENFKQVSSEDWAKLQQKGADAIEKTYDEEVVNRAKTIFVFKNDQLNYFESNYQPFDIDVDGDYLESCRNVDNILYETFIAQMPGIKVDTTRTTEHIDGLEFQTFKLTVEYPNKMVLHLLMFSRLFDKREFTVSISYVDKSKGEEMLNSWKKSKFER